MTSGGESRVGSEASRAAGRLLFPVWVTVCAAAALFPILVLFMVSVAPGAALFGERPPLIVTAPTFRFWRAVLESGDLWAPLAQEPRGRRA